MVLGVCIHVYVVYTYTYFINEIENYNSLGHILDSVFCMYVSMYVLYLCIILCINACISVIEEYIHKLKVLRIYTYIHTRKYIFHFDKVPC